VSNVIEVRSIHLKTGTREEFHRLYLEEALPRLLRWSFDVVAYGPSLHDETSFYVIRRFESLDHRQRSEDTYYASDDWRKGPREAMLALMEGYADVVLELSDAAVAALRR
jgi:hypothetical protein